MGRASLCTIPLGLVRAAQGNYCDHDNTSFLAISGECVHTRVALRPSSHFYITGSVRSPPRLAGHDLNTRNPRVKRVELAVSANVDFSRWQAEVSTTPPRLHCPRDIVAVTLRRARPRSTSQRLASVERCTSWNSNGSTDAAVLPPCRDTLSRSSGAIGGRLEAQQHLPNSLAVSAASIGRVTNWGLRCPRA
jgi:hypothetical protein